MAAVVSAHVAGGLADGGTRVSCEVSPAPASEEAGEEAGRCLRVDADARGAGLAGWLDEQEAAAANPGLGIALRAVAGACAETARIVSRGTLPDHAPAPAPAARDAPAVNASGERQKKLDVVSHAVFELACRNCGRVAMLVSEEVRDPVAFPAAAASASEPGTENSRYVVACDPLDGSSNVDYGGTVGSIFGVWAYPPETPSTSEAAAATCHGRTMLAAGYCMYSSSCVLVLTLGDGVYGFTLDHATDDFVLTHVRMRVPDSGKIYSFNEGNFALWETNLQSYVTQLKDGGQEANGAPYSARYIGCLVGDFHRTLLYGGIYGYPADAKNPNGKLRLLYECAPMSLIIEQAGGKGSTGHDRVLSVSPRSIHQRVPYFVGSRAEVDFLEACLRR